MIDFIERQLAETIREAAKYFSVICITGPRQSGKSTLIKHLFPDFLQYSMEDYNIRDFALHDPIAFFSQSPGGMVIDEVQRAPELLSYIQGIVDSDPQRRFVLSGSSNFLLLKDVSQSLAGRAGIFELLPMSYAEVRDIYKTKSLDELLYGGLYPAICAEKNRPEFMYGAYTRTYLDKDVRTLVNVNSLPQFHTFLKLCAMRIGSIFNASELAGEVGVSSNTIKSWLSVLETSYVLMRLQPWSENVGKRLTKSPKLYFCDTGLACHLLEIESPAQLARDKMRGHLFENFVVMEIMKHRYNRGKDGGVYFYRDAKGNEVDILLKEEGEITAIEVKSSMTYSSSFEKSIRQLSRWVSTPVVRKMIVYAGDFENTAGEVEIRNYRSL